MTPWPWGLLAGLVGALLVFVWGLLRERWRNYLEQEGLARMLLAEVEHNEEVTWTIGERTWDLLSSEDLRAVRSDTWQASKVRAAQLLPRCLIKNLIDYHSSLRILLTLRDFRNRPSDRADRGLRTMIAEARPDLNVALTRNPYEEYTKKTLVAQGEARRELEEYLNRPGWRRFFGRR